MRYRFVLLLLVLLASCAPAVPAVPTTTPDLNAIGTLVAATNFSGMTATALAIPTATVTPEPTATLTPSPTATPALDFTQLRIVSLSFNRSYDLTITLEIPNLYNDTGTYVGRIEQYEYKCVRDVAYPERLFCYGYPLRPGTLWTFTLHPERSTTVLFTKKVTIPEPPIPGDLSPYLAAGCEVEPLYQPWWPQGKYPQFEDPSRNGCYVISCHAPDPSNPSVWVFTCGTGDTCVSMPEPPCP